MTRFSQFFISLALMFSTTAAMSQAWNASVDKEALRSALDQNTSCNKTCASNLADMIIDKSAEEVTDPFATLRKPNVKPRSYQLAMFYAFIRRTTARGEKIISSHGACSNECDKLNADAVALARAGALGPMLHDGKVNPAVFQDPRILDLYMKYIKPISADQLPWTFHNEDWWKKLSSTG